MTLDTTLSTQSASRTRACASGAGSTSLIKLMLASLLTTMALSAITAPAAQAECGGNNPEKKCIWQVKDNAADMFTQLVAPESELIVTPQENTAMKLVAGALEVKCTTFKANNVLIGGNRGKDFASFMEFSGCTTNSGTAGCKVKAAGRAVSGLIDFRDIPTELREAENEAGTIKNILADRFEQKLHRGTLEIGTLEFGTTEAQSENGKFERPVLTGACEAFPANTKVKGSVEAEVGTEKFSFPTPALKQSALVAFGVKATLSMSFKARRDLPGEFRGL